MGRSFLAFVLAPVTPIDEWLAELDRSIARSSDFFANRPVILDLLWLLPSQDDAQRLIEEIEFRGLRLISVEGVDAGWIPRKFAPLPSGSQPVGMYDSANGTAGDRPEASPSPLSLTATTSKSTSLLIDTPVRSGQSIVFADGDVTIVGSVASGAEVVAGGSIHIYGPLRGRAIAGAWGNTRAQIFCSNFEGEILAINGFYKTAEDTDASLRGAAIHAHLERDEMKVEALN